ncbi:MAG TPA: hypothetical protein VF816_04105 [Rhodocyclaceae bacterium]
MTNTLPAKDARVVKKLQPGAPGTKRLAERFGSRLLCVRYRIDEQTQRRYTTVELLVDEAPCRPQSGDVLVRVAFEEAELRRRVKEAGGMWQQTEKLWRLPHAKAKQLGLLERIRGRCRNA